MFSSTFSDLPPECPVCDGPGQYLGQLGDLDHWTCRHCGMQFSTPANNDDPADDPWDGTDEW